MKETILGERCELAVGPSQANRRGCTISPLLPVQPGENAAFLKLEENIALSFASCFLELSLCSHSPARALLHCAPRANVGIASSWRNWTLSFLPLLLQIWEGRTHYVRLQHAVKVLRLGLVAVLSSSCSWLELGTVALLFQSFWNCWLLLQSSLLQGFRKGFLWVWQIWKKFT